MLGSLERDFAPQSRQKCEPARTRTAQRTELSLGSRPVPEPAKTKTSSSQGGANLSFRDRAGFFGPIHSFTLAAQRKPK